MVEAPASPRSVAERQAGGQHKQQQETAARRQHNSRDGGQPGPQLHAQALRQPGSCSALCTAALCWSGELCAPALGSIPEQRNGVLQGGEFQELCVLVGRLSCSPAFVDRLVPLMRRASLSAVRTAGIVDLLRFLWACEPAMISQNLACVFGCRSCSP
jgi:hypothetical protein